SSSRRHTRSKRDWSSDVCSSDLVRGHHRIRGAYRAARDPAGRRALASVSGPVVGAWRGGIAEPGRYCRAYRHRFRRSADRYFHRRGRRTDLLALIAAHIARSGNGCDMSALSLHHVTLSIGNATILDDVSLALPSEAVTGIIVPNGAGNSSVIAVASGQLHPQ